MTSGKHFVNVDRSNEQNNLYRFITFDILVEQVKSSIFFLFF